MTRSLAIWMTLVAFLVASCSTAMNVRREEYGRIEPDRDYRIVMADSVEYDATNLVIKDDVTSFTQKGAPVTVPTSEIALIQQINSNEVLTGVVGLGIVAALVGGLMVLMKPD